MGVGFRSTLGLRLEIQIRVWGLDRDKGLVLSRV